MILSSPDRVHSVLLAALASFAGIDDAVEIVEDGPFVFLVDEGDGRHVGDRVLRHFPGDHLDARFLRCDMLFYSSPDEFFSSRAHAYFDLELSNGPFYSVSKPTLTTKYALESF